MSTRGDDHEFTTVLQTRFAPTEAPDTGFSLQVVEGVDAGHTHVLDGSSPLRLLVGTSEACAFRLRDREVSRRHAACELAGSHLHLRDLASKNGTFVNGVRIIEALVHPGDRLRLGSTVLQVEAQAAQPAALPATTRFGKVVGASREMRRLYPLCERLAAVDLPVIIEGETGTGKEVLAESLHERSPRAQAPFVVFDCTAVPPNLVESELFGHERGAFTGATTTRKGVFEQADGGTLLIDEIGDLDLALQPKLLRAVERGEVRRVGGDRWISVNVRILAATRRDLDREVQEGRFRDDLFHRLAIARIELPPLRARKGDVTTLARELSHSFAGSADALPPELLLRWERYAWPGNVRELRNAVARYLALGTLGDLVRGGSQGAEVERDLAEVVSARGDATGDDIVRRVLAEGLPLIPARQRVIEHFEERYIAHVLEAHGGNVSKAAATSGVARRHFHRLKAKSRSGG